MASECDECHEREADWIVYPPGFDADSSGRMLCSGCHPRPVGRTAKAHSSAIEAVYSAFRSGSQRDRRMAIRALCSAAQKAGAEEMRERAAVRMTTGAEIESEYARADAANAIRALPTEPGEEAGA